MVRIFREFQWKCQICSKTNRLRPGPQLLYFHCPIMKIYNIVYLAYKSSRTILAPNCKKKFYPNSYDIFYFEIPFNFISTPWYSEAAVKCNYKFDTKSKACNIVGMQNFFLMIQILEKIMNYVRDLFACQKC